MLEKWDEKNIKSIEEWSKYIKEWCEYFLKTHSSCLARLDLNRCLDRDSSYDIIWLEKGKPIQYDGHVIITYDNWFFTPLVRHPDEFPFDTILTYKNFEKKILYCYNISMKRHQLRKIEKEKEIIKKEFE